MLKTLLFDLDGTLLPVDTDRFVNHYLKMLAEKIATFTEPKHFICHLLKATDVMIHHQNPNKTNQEVFWETFSPMIPCKSETLTRVLNEFYELDFPKLSFILEESGSSVSYDILRCAFEKGYEVVIATNPIFPKVAVFDRLRWIGAHDFSFRLVTTYEIMRYSKPYKDYYLEILGMINRKPSECMMIGNDMDEDMVAGELGMGTFLVTDHLINRNNLDISVYQKGTLGHLKTYIGNLKNLKEETL